MYMIKKILFEARCHCNNPGPNIFDFNIIIIINYYNFYYICFFGHRN